MKALEDPKLPLTLSAEMICRILIPVHPRTLKRWVAAGEFPAADISKGRKIRLWYRETVEHWMEQNSSKKQS